MLSAEDEASLSAAHAEFDDLTEQHQAADELSDDVDARFGELEAEIERLEARRTAYDADDVSRGGAFVVLNHDGTVRIERGFIRPGTRSPDPKPNHRRPQRQGRPKVRTVRQSKRGRRMARAARMRTMMTVRCLTSLFATSPHIAPWDCGSV